MEEISSSQLNLNKYYTYINWNNRNSGDVKMIWDYLFIGDEYVLQERLIDVS